MSDPGDTEPSPDQVQRKYRSRRRAMGFSLMILALILGLGPWLGKWAGRDADGLRVLLVVVFGIVLFFTMVRASFCVVCGGRMKLDGRTCSACNKTYTDS